MANDGSQKYFEMLRTSVDRAAKKVTAQIVHHAGGTEKNILIHPSWLLLRTDEIVVAGVGTKALHSRVDDETMVLDLCKQILSRAGSKLSPRNLVLNVSIFSAKNRAASISFCSISRCR